ncbi:hypothetical protein N7495_008054 [Penicillium taxi]|uniref:uncharacterized protein n=1 Tax=Penicillium taxi TaxID=168475 RepID=UPI002544EDDC|nr:uncharacterized protein N7495_008054 [Penicillium taxi]KAJ5888013.1 hypothetical protein N7495_008054 [Penicillium taxi]
MPWYSILPPQLIQIEIWLVRIFLFLGLFTIFPWAALIVFDAGLYVYRMVLWNFPRFGGRASGRQRPRAPSLNERPNGQLRTFGLRGVEIETDTDTGKGGHKSLPCEAVTDTIHEQAGLVGKENVSPTANWRAHSNAGGDLKHRPSTRT